METVLRKRFRGLWKLVGNTPLLAIDFLYKGEKRVIYAKSEQYNITGSIKDRMALYILEKAYENGEIKTGDTIIEATSGNTGIAFSAIGRALGHNVNIIMPDWMSRERVDIISSLGAKIIPVSKEEGGFVGSIKLAESISNKEPNIFLPSQFSNKYNVEAHYKTTGPEIWSQLKFNNLVPDAFIAGVGTGGTIMGAGAYLKKWNPAIFIHPLEPSESPTLSMGYKSGHHRIQGISDEFIPSIVNLNELDSVISVSDGDSIIMAQKLAAQIGIAVGISSGANFIGALKIQNKLGPESTVVTIFADDNKKYLSTDLLRNEPVKNDHLSKDIDIIGFRSFKRVCFTCCDPEECGEARMTEEIEELALPHCPRRK